MLRDTGNPELEPEFKRIRDYRGISTEYGVRSTKVSIDSVHLTCGKIEKLKKKEASLVKRLKIKSFPCTVFPASKFSGVFLLD